MAEARSEIEDGACGQTANRLAICPGPATEGYSKRELREIDSNLTLPQSRAREMADLISEVNGMNWFQRLMDSKVPNSKRSFWHRFTLKLSDPEALREEIANHEEFYANMEAAFRRVRDCDEDAEELIEELYEKLMHFYTEDKLQVDKDDSKRLCRLHEEFVAEKDKLENSMRKVEGCNTRRQLRKTKEMLNGAVAKIDDVTKKMEQAKDENKNLLARVETLVTMNENLMVQQQDIRGEREREHDSFRNLEEKFERVLFLNEQLMEDRKKEREKNDLMMVLLENLLKKPPENGEQ